MQNTFIKYYIYSQLRYSILLIFLISSTVSATPKTITFAYQNSHNYPYQTGTGASINREKPGILLEMLKIVEKEIDINIKFVRFPWKRALFELKNGKAADSILQQEKIEFKIL